MFIFTQDNCIGSCLACAETFLSYTCSIELEQEEPVNIAMETDELDTSLVTYSIEGIITV